MRFPPHYLSLSLSVLTVAIPQIVIYTASLSKYADPLLDKLDIHNVIDYRLFRESCVYHEGHYVKDLSLLNRDVSQCIIVDNSPMSYTFHPGPPLSFSALPAHLLSSGDQTMRLTAALTSMIPRTLRCGRSSFLSGSSL
jgi:hypothetical protein